MLKKIKLFFFKIFKKDIQCLFNPNDNIEFMGVIDNFYEALQKLENRSIFTISNADLQDAVEMFAAIDNIPIRVRIFKEIEEANFSGLLSYVQGGFTDADLSNFFWGIFNIRLDTGVMNQIRLRYLSLPIEDNEEHLEEAVLQ